MIRSWDTIPRERGVVALRESYDRERETDSQARDVELKKAREKNEKTAAGVVDKSLNNKKLTLSEAKFLESAAGRMAVRSELFKRDIDLAALYVDMIQDSAADSRKTEKGGVPADIRLKNRRHVTNELARIMRIEDSRADGGGGDVIFNIEGDLVIGDPGNKNPICPVREADEISPDGSAPPV